MDKGDGANARALLIRDAGIGNARADVLVRGGVIARIGNGPHAGCRVVDARGGALLPGLHDHHIHLNAAAAALQSVRCGPPEVRDADALIAALASAPGEGWLRGVGYHASVAGEIGREWLDRHGPARPVRIQHRGGRLWMLNARALAALGLDPRGDGRLLDADRALRARAGAMRPDPRPVGAYLATRGVTGLTEVTPHNGIADYTHLAQAGLPQWLLVMGGAELDDAPPLARARRGAVKLHYHDHDLPALDALTAEVARAHSAGRAVAAHCVTAAELMLILTAIEEAGSMQGDRIEHGAIVTPANAEWIARLGLTVVTQPHFLAERGDAYLREVDRDDLPWLYRLAGLKRAGIALAAGSDAPFGGLDPWAAMAAAVTRPPGFGADEALSPEEALALFTGAADAPGMDHRSVAPGEPADLCLLDRPWDAAAADLGAVEVRLTLVAGEVIHAVEAK